MTFSAARTTYVYVWPAAVAMDALKRGQDNEQGMLCWMTAITFTAFMLEGFLNTLGTELLDCWEGEHERKDVQQKIELLAEIGQLHPCFGERPYQTVSCIFKFRDALAHPKTVLTKDRHRERFRHGDPLPSVQPRVEKYAKRASAERCFEDSKAIMLELYEKCMGRRCLWADLMVLGKYDIEEARSEE